MKIRNLLPATGEAAGQDNDHSFHSLQRRMNSLFDDFFSGFDAAPRAVADGFGAFIPSVDIKESDKDFTIYAELPGVDEKDVEVTVTQNSVTIKGEKKEEKETKGKNYYHMERSYGSFNRVISLTAQADASRASASFKNGVLNITIPKSESAKAKGTKIPITAP